MPPYRQHTTIYLEDTLCQEISRKDKFDNNWCFNNETAFKGQKILWKKNLWLSTLNMFDYHSFSVTIFYSISEISLMEQKIPKTLSFWFWKNLALLKKMLLWYVPLILVESNKPKLQWYLIEANMEDSQEWWVHYSP